MDVIWLLSVTGRDCPETLHHLTETVAFAEGTILDSQLATMDGFVSGLFKVRVPQAHADWMQQRLAGFGHNGLQVSIGVLTPVAADTEPRLSLTVCGTYRPGLDHDIRLILESHGADVEQCHQHLVGVPLFGEHRFQFSAHARLNRPPIISRLKAALGRLADGLEIDIRTETLIKA